MNKMILGLMAVLLSCCLVSCGGKSDAPIYTYSPEKGLPPGSSSGTSAPPQPSPPQKHGEFAVRNIVIDERNSIFSIGIPAGQTEERQVAAEKPINYGFEYLPREAILTVNGVAVARSPRWELKLGYVEGVTKFSYTIRNPTGAMISYNLHLVPAKPGTSVAVTFRERWIP